MAPDCKVFTQNAGGAAIVAPEQGTSVAVSRREEKRNRRESERGWGGVKKGDLADLSPAFRSLPRGAHMYTRTHTPHTQTCASPPHKHTTKRGSSAAIQPSLALLPSSHLALCSCDLFHC